MTNGSFGQRLKRERELRGVSRDEVCAATRIGPRFLDALENEKWELLPGGIFNRGFIRAVARFLGLDEDDLVAEYDLAIAAQQTSPVLTPGAAPTPQPPPVTHRSPGPRRALMVGLSFVVLLIAAFIGWKWHTHSRPSLTSNASISARPSGAQAQHGSPESVLQNPAGPSTTTGSGSDTDTQHLDLKIEAGKETTVSISVDGNKVFDGNMIAGQSRSFTAHQEITISAQDGGALLLELNGHTLPPLGPPGQPGSATLTPGDLQFPAGGAN